MKRALGLVFLVALALPSLSAQTKLYQQGTVTRMRMTECLLAPGFMQKLAGVPMQGTAGNCPEYTLVSDKVVYVVVGKSSDQLIPLAENIDFRLQKNELAVRLDDSRHESRYSIREMELRADWEREEIHRREAMRSAAEGHARETLARAGTN